MRHELDGYRSASGPSGFVPTTKLTDEQTRELSRAVDALAEPLSRRRGDRRLLGLMADRQSSRGGPCSLRPATAALRLPSAAGS